MGKAFGADRLSGLALQRVIANGFGSTQTFFKIARLHRAGARGPDARIAICLQFHTDLQLVALRLADALLLALDIG